MPANKQNDRDRTYSRFNMITVSIIVLYGLSYNMRGGLLKHLGYTCTDISVQGASLTRGPGFIFSFVPISFAVGDFKIGTPQHRYGLLKICLYF